MSTIPALILKDPIWEQQEEEQNKQYFFAGLFIRCDDTVEEFYHRMDMEYTSNGKEGFLKYAPYSLTYFRTLCTQHKWIERRVAFQKHRDEKLFAEMDEIDRESKLEIFKYENEAELRIWRRLSLAELTPAGMEHLAKAGKLTKDSKNRDLGKPKDITKIDADIEADVEGSISEQNIFKYSDEEMQRIQNISNDNEDFLDEL